MRILNVCYVKILYQIRGPNETTPTKYEDAPPSFPTTFSSEAINGPPVCTINKNYKNTIAITIIKLEIN